jgi:hypothetical protein
VPSSMSPPCSSPTSPRPPSTARPATKSWTCSPPPPAPPAAAS